jgi:hypothetical protein
MKSSIAFGSDEMMACVQEAVAEAIETHRRMGRPVVVWQNERVRWIRPEELEPRPLPGDDWQPPSQEAEHDSSA